MEISNAPEHIAPYIQLGMKIDSAVSGDEAIGECVFCSKRKLYVNKHTGQYSCKVCSSKGNIHTFVKVFHELLLTLPTRTEKLDILSENRSIPVSTLSKWNVVYNPYRDQFIVPGYNPVSGKLSNLYSYVKLQASMAIIGVKGLKPAMFGLDQIDSQSHSYYICEGPWDAMALSFALSNSKRRPEKVNVVAIPGCNVFKDSWASLFAGKQVTILFDNDYPGKNSVTGQELPPAGWNATERIYSVLTNSAKPPKTISVLQWGPTGYTNEYPNGYDVRDLLTKELS